MTFFHTAEFYGPFANEEPAVQALTPVRDQVVIAAKFGLREGEHGPFSASGWIAEPSRSVEGPRVCSSLCKRIASAFFTNLYQHRVEPDVAIEDVEGPSAAGRASR